MTWQLVSVLSAVFAAAFSVTWWLLQRLFRRIDQALGENL